MQGPARPPASLSAVIYLNIQVVKGQRKVICLLKEQISNVSATSRFHPRGTHLAVAWAGESVCQTGCTHQ